MKNKNKYTLLGVAIGDLAGSRFEHHPHKSKDFELLVAGDFNARKGYSVCNNELASYFTDDTIMTTAVTKALLDTCDNYKELQSQTIRCMKDFGYRYPSSGYGHRFKEWLNNPFATPYYSLGNGSAMRIAPVAYFAKDLDEVKKLSYIVTATTHNHPEGIKGAESVAMAIYLARSGASMEEIRARMIEYYPEIEKLTVDGIRVYCNVDDGTFITCQRSVPEAIVCFLESTSFEDAVRNAVSLGGDADTQGAITGSIAEAYYGVPVELEDKALSYLLPDLENIYYAFNTIKGKRTERKPV